jgi:hypothetical protein
VFGKRDESKYRLLSADFAKFRSLRSGISFRKFSIIVNSLRHEDSASRKQDSSKAWPLQGGGIYNIALVQSIKIKDYQDTTDFQRAMGG